MGPFVHVASIAGNLLSNLAAFYDGAYANEGRKSEMLNAACAVGVASVRKLLASSTSFHHLSGFFCSGGWSLVVD